MGGPERVSRPWAIVNHDRFLVPGSSNTFELSILPLRNNTPVYFEIPDPLRFSPNRLIAKLDDLSLYLSTKSPSALPPGDRLEIPARLC